MVHVVLEIVVVVKGIDPETVVDLLEIVVVEEGVDFVETVVVVNEVETVGVEAAETVAVSDLPEIVVVVVEEGVNFVDSILD